MSRSFCYVYIAESACWRLVLMHNILAKAMSSQANDALTACMTLQEEATVASP